MSGLGGIPARHAGARRVGEDLFRCGNSYAPDRRDTRPTGEGRTSFRTHPTPAQVGPVDEPALLR